MFAAVCVRKERDVVGVSNFFFFLIKIKFRITASVAGRPAEPEDPRQGAGRAQSRRDDGRRAVRQRRSDLQLPRLQPAAEDRGTRAPLVRHICGDAFSW